MDTDKKKRLILKIEDFGKRHDYNEVCLSFEISQNDHGDFNGEFRFIEWDRDGSIVKVKFAAPQIIEDLVEKQYGMLIRFPSLNTCKWCDEVYDIADTIQKFGEADWTNRYCSAKCYADIQLDRIKRAKETDEYIPKSHLLYVSAMTVVTAYKTYRKSFPHISPRTMTPAIKEALKAQGLPADLVSLFYLSFVGHPMDLVHWAEGVVHRAVCPHCKQNQITEGPCSCIPTI